MLESIVFKAEDSVQVTDAVSVLFLKKFFALYQLRVPVLTFHCLCVRKNFAANKSWCDIGYDAIVPL